MDKKEGDREKMDKARMRFLIEELGRRIAQTGNIVEIAVFGGSALVLRFDLLRIATEDIDYIGLSPGIEILQEKALEVAKEFGIHEDWINDAIMVNNLSDRPQYEFYGDFPEERPGLRVFVASPQYVFAMKALSMRSSFGSNDVEDLWKLWDELGLETANDALAIIDSFYPGYELPRRSVLLLQDIEEWKAQKREYSPLLGW